MEGEVHGLLLSDGCLLGVICTARMWSKDRPKFVWNELLDACLLCRGEAEMPDGCLRRRTKIASGSEDRCRSKLKRMATSGEACAFPGARFSLSSRRERSFEVKEMSSLNSNPSNAPAPNWFRAVDTMRRAWLKCRGFVWLVAFCELLLLASLPRLGGCIEDCDASPRPWDGASI